MEIEERIQSVLVADTGIQQLITDPANIRPPGDWENMTPPYIIHRPVSVVPNHTHTGTANLKTWRYQIDCFGRPYSSAKALAKAVRLALQSYRAGSIVSFWVGEGPTFYQQNINVHQIPVEFEIADAL